MSKEEYEIYHNYPKWRENLKQYENEKKNLQWGRNPSPNIISHKVVKEREQIFNPISQKYYSETTNKSVELTDKQRIKDKLSKEYDRSLRYEQTYNIVNLTDKFKGMENHEKYLKQPGLKVKTKNEPVKNFNILSNISNDKHSYLPPEKRPIIPNDNNHHNSSRPIKAHLYKDYDIISNNYRFNHDTKVKADHDLASLDAARKFWRTHEYDHVRNHYYDNEKQEKYLKNKNEETLKNAHEKLEKQYYYINKD